jgi:GR25 family glycosyltransferase involved in LPS biosynthesis
MKAYVISLSKIESSITTAKSVLKELLKQGFAAELFEGTYGNDAVLLYLKEKRSVHPYGIKSIPLTDEELESLKTTLPNDIHQRYSLHGFKRAALGEKEQARVLRPGVLGCFYSHYRLWQKCVELNEPIFIFEDDVIFKRSYIQIDWQDILIIALGKDLYKTKYADVYETPQGGPTALEFLRTSMPGAVGYGIKPHAAKKLVDTYSKTVLAADNAINQHEVKIQIHSHLIGRAALDEDGKVSLTSSSAWE